MRFESSDFESSVFENQDVENHALAKAWFLRTMLSVVAFPEIIESMA
jgi:hypothetical protein